jgi:hypothetical protein
VAIFSWIDSSRCVEAITVVRAGDTKPSSIMRPTSRNSGATSTSSAPGTGYSENAGSAEPRSE